MEGGEGMNNHSGHMEDDFGINSEEYQVTRLFSQHIYSRY